jgi:hypothetical protein
MFEWITRNWRDQWLGNFAWWQGLAAVVQAIFAGLLFYITRHYVRLTRELVATQFEPVVLLEQSGQSGGIGTAESVTVRNLGKKGNSERCR